MKIIRYKAFDPRLPEYQVREGKRPARDPNAEADKKAAILPRADQPRRS